MQKPSLGPNLYGKLKPPEFLFHTASQLVYLTLQCLYTLQWAAILPPKIAPSPWGTGSYLIHDFLGPPDSP